VCSSDLVADLAARANQAPPGSVRPPAASAPITPFLPPLNDLGMDNQRVQHPYQQGQGALDRLAALQQAGRPPVANPDRLIANDLAGPEALLAEQAPTPESFAAQLARVQQARNLAAAEERRINELTAAGRDPRERDPDAMWGVAEYARDVTNAGEAFIRDPSRETALGLVGTAYQPIDWGRQHVGRPIAGELLYQLAERKNLSRAIAAIPGVGAPVLALEAIMTANPGFRQRVIDAHQRGGPVAVWEDAVAGAADDWHPALRALYLGVADFVIDPLGLPLAAATGGGAVVAKTAAREAAEQSAALAARRAAGELVTEGIRPATRAKALLGDVLQTPQRVLDVTADVPFTAAGALGRRALGPLAQPSRASGERLAQEEAARALNLAARALTRAPTSPVDISAATVFPAERPLALPEPAWRVSPRGDVVPPGGGPPPPRGAPEVWPVEAAVRDARTPPRPAEADVPAGPWEPTRDGGVRTRVRYYGSRSQFGTRVVDHVDGTFSVQKRQKNRRYQPLPGMTGLDEATADQAARRVVLREQGKLPEGTALVEPVPEQAPLPEPTPVASTIPETIGTGDDALPPRAMAEGETDATRLTASDQATVGDADPTVLPPVHSPRQVAGRLRLVTPDPNGNRLIDRAKRWASQYPERWRAFADDYREPARQLLREQNDLDQQGFHDFAEKRARQKLSALDHIVFELAPRYRRHFGDVDTDTLIPATEARRFDPSGAEQSFTHESDEWLMERVVLDLSEPDANGALSVLRHRYKDAPWFPEIEARLMQTRRGMKGLQPDDAWSFGPSRKINAQSGGGTGARRKRVPILRDGQPTGYELDQPIGARADQWTLYFDDQPVRGDDWQSIVGTRGELLNEARGGRRDAGDLPPGAQPGAARVGLVTGADAAAALGRRLPEPRVAPAAPDVPPAPGGSLLDDLQRWAEVDDDAYATLTQRVPYQGENATLFDVLVDQLGVTGGDAEQAVRRTLDLLGEANQPYRSWTERAAGARANGVTRFIAGTRGQPDRYVIEAADVAGANGRTRAASKTAPVWSVEGPDLDLTGLTFKEAQAEVNRRLPTRARSGRLRQADRAYLGALQGIREAVQYNWARGVAGIIGDLADAWTLAWNGHPGAALATLTAQRRARQFYKLQATNLADGVRATPAATELTELGLDPLTFSRDVTRAETRSSGKMAVERAVERATGGRVAGRTTRAAQEVIASRWLRDFRHAQDVHRRFTVGVDEISRRLPEARLAFLQQVWARERALHLPHNSLRAKIDELGARFSPEDVARVTGDQRLARDWRQQVRQLEKSGHAEVNRLLFSYQGTNLDEIAKRALFFSYWTSRALALHSRTAMRNPHLMNLYLRMMEDAEQQAREGGYPESVRGFVAYLGDRLGFRAFFDPLAVLSAAATFQEVGQASGEDAGLWDQYLSKFVFVNPLVQSAAAILGQMEPTNPTGTYAHLGVIRDAIDVARNTLGLGSPGVTTAPAELIERATVRLNHLIADHVPLVGRLPEPPHGAYDRDMVLSLVQEALEQEYGPWTSENPNWVVGPEGNGPAYADFLAAAHAYDGGVADNALLNQAYRDWANARGLARVASTIRPGQGALRYGPRDQAMLDADAGYTALEAGAEPTPAQEAAINERFAATHPTNVTELANERAGLDAIGTEMQRWWWDDWNQIVQDEFRPLEGIIIHGAFIPGEAIMAMSHDERADLADAWIAQYNTAEYDATADLDAYREERAAFIADHPELASYEEYQDVVGDFSDPAYGEGARGFRSRMEQVSPSFAAAIAEERDRLARAGKTGALAEAELDGWTFGRRAYAAATGTAYGSYDEPPEPVYDPSQDARAAWGVGGETTGFGEAAPKSYGTRVRDAMRSYEAAVRRWETTTGLSIDALYSPMARQAYAALYGEDLIPTPSALLQRYWEWAALQPAGADASPEAFGRFLEELARQSAAGLLTDEDAS